MSPYGGSLFFAYKSSPIMKGVILMVYLIITMLLTFLIVSTVIDALKDNNQKGGDLYVENSSKMES